MPVARTPVALLLAALGCRMVLLPLPHLRSQGLHLSIEIA
jgi:hypothetical protein